MSPGSAWSTFGAWPALPMAGLFYVAVFGAALALPEGTSSWIGIGLVTVLIAYCVARPHGGWNVFWVVALPGVIASIVRDSVGAPGWVGLLVLPVVLVVLRDIDRERGSRTDDPEPGIAATATTDGGATARTG